MRNRRPRTIRAAASIADKALNENRAVGMTVNAGRMAYLPADRGGRQHQKVMQLLAAVDADSSTPLVETLIASVGRLRRGMTAVVITASTDAALIRPLASLRTRVSDASSSWPTAHATLHTTRLSVPRRPAER